MIFGLIALIFIQQTRLIFCQNLPYVPCPDIFEYVYDGRTLSGQITLPTPDVDKVVLIASFTVPENDVKDIGKLDLFNEKAINDIRNGRPLKYVYTLAKSKYISQLTEITYNGNIVCVGPEISDPPYSKFSLTHTFNLHSSDISLPETPSTAFDTQTQPPPFRPPNNNETDLELSASDKYNYKNDQNCGLIRNKREVNYSGVVNFIYNGTVVARNDHPWLAALYDTDVGPLKFFCGGNLISNKHVLTAAHCTLNKINIQVKVGAHNTKEAFELGVTLRDAEWITNHPEYKEGSGHADISIIYLSEEVEYTSTIKPICLWNSEDDINRIVGDRGTIMGWGLTENRDPSPVPLQTDIIIVSQQECQSVEILKNAISNMTFCAGTKGAGPCMGDSGGGLLLKKQGRWYLRGIISISVGNRRQKICDVNTYAVYVDTAKYMDWIIENMEE